MEARRRVLLVCFGNLCRSPMAEGLLRARLPARRFEVASAGTHALGGSPPTDDARAAVEALEGIDISGNRSRPLSRPLVRDADYVLTMSRAQAAEVVALVPEAAERTWLFGAFAAAGEAADLPTEPGGEAADPEEVGDPMGGGADVYRACARRLARAADGVAAWLLERSDEAPEPASEWLQADPEPPGSILRIRHGP